MAKQIASLSVGLSMNDARFQKGAKAAKKHLKGMEKAAFNAGAKLLILTAVIAKLGGAAIRAVKSGFRQLNEQFEKIDAIGKLSTSLNIATEALIGFQNQAALSGAGPEALTKGLQFLTKTIGEANIDKPLAAVTDAFNKLGLDAAKLANMPLEQSFAEISDALNKTENASQRAYLANKLFGGSWKKLNNMLMLGSEGLAKNNAELKQMGILIDGVDTSGVETMNDAFTRAGLFFEGLWRQLAVKIAPAVTVLVDKFTDWAIKGSSASERVTKSLGYVLGAFGFITDVLDIAKMGFMALRIGAGYALYGIIKALDGLAQGLIGLADLLGLDIKDTWLSEIGNVADAMLDEIEKSKQSLEDAWLAPPPSQKIEEWWGGIQDGIAKAKEQVKTKGEDSISTKAFEDTMKVDEAIAKLREKVNNIGKDALEIELAKLTALKATKEQLQDFIILYGKLDLAKDAEALVKGLQPEQSALDKFLAFREKIRNMLANELISVDQYYQLDTKEAKKLLGSETQKDIKQATTGITERGSVAAFNRIAASRNDTGPSLQQKQLTEQQKSRDELKKINNTLKKNGAVEVVELPG